METAVKNSIKKTEAKQKIQLVDGLFTVSEANDIVQSLINEKVNFHKLQRLTMCEGFSGANTKFPDGRIATLEHDKSVAKKFFKQLNSKDVTIKINGVLEIYINDSK